MSHARDEGPLFVRLIEHCRVPSSAERVVADGASDRQHTAIGEKRVAAAEKVEGSMIGRFKGRWMREIVGRGRQWVPHDAGVDLLGHVAKIRRGKTRGAAARPGKKQHF